MSTYQAPLRDMQFALRELAGAEDVAKLPGFEGTLDVLDSVLEEAASFASGVLDPLNAKGDREGCTWKDGEVTTPGGFKEAYRQFARADWIGLPVATEYGGQGLPSILLEPTLEMWNAANVGFANGPLLNQGAIGAIELTGSEEQKQLYIPKLVSGEWTGTMCLTEPQAGSDLAQVRPKAITTASADRRSSSRSASTIWPITSCTWCWLVFLTRRKAPKASRCSSCRNSSSIRMDHWASATTSTARASSTSWASMPTLRAR